MIEDDDGDDIGRWEIIRHGTKVAEADTKPQAHARARAEKGAHPNMHISVRDKKTGWSEPID
jgi:hypothetical protein